MQSHYQSIYTKEQQKAWHRSYKLCNCKRYSATYNTAVYSGNGRTHATPSVTATDTIIAGLTAGTDNVEHKLYTDSPAPELLDDSHTETMWDCYGPV